MKVKIWGVIDVEEIIEVDDRYENAVIQGDIWFQNTKEEMMEIERLSNEVAHIASSYLYDKYGNNLHKHSISVYDLDHNPIYEE